MSDSMVAFAGSRLDRADHVRADPDALGRLMNGTARLLRLDELDPVIGPDGSLEWGSLAEADPDSELVFLGLNGGHGHFAEVPTALRGSVMPANGKMWGAMQALEPSELATYGGARALVGWHARHRFCAVCGSPEVQKDLMAPSLAGAGAEAPDPAPTLSAPLSPAEQAMAELRRRIEARSENVGRDFAAEARRIHEGSSPDRPIIGEAKPSEARALIEDGIPVAPLPWSSRKSN